MSYKNSYKKNPKASKGYVTKAQYKKDMRKNNELKYHCRDDLVAISCGSGGLLRSLSLVPQGVTGITRDGNQITAKYLVIRGAFSLADTDNICRLVIARLSKLKGATVSESDFPFSGIAGAGTVNSPFACWTDRKNELVVLHDRLYQMGATSNNVAKFDVKINVNAVLQYDGTATTAAETNDLVLFAISDSTAPTHPTIRFASQLSFTDA